MNMRILGAVAALLFSALTAFAADLPVDGNLRLSCGTATTTLDNGSTASATLNNKCGVITTASLSNPGSSLYTLTLTNSVAAAGDVVLFTVANGSNTTGQPGSLTATPTAGTVVFTLRETGVAPFNGTLTVRYLLIK